MIDTPYVSRVYDIDNKELEGVISELLDISKDHHNSAVTRYKGLGDWLDQDTCVASFGPQIYPQGSFLLGTVTKSISNEDDYDLDFVTELKQPANDITPWGLKNLVGDAIKIYVSNSSYQVSLQEEGRRCWTLDYSGDAQFHMDVLPAIPKEKVPGQVDIEQDSADGIKVPPYVPPIIPQGRVPEQGDDERGSDGVEVPPDVQFISEGIIPMAVDIQRGSDDFEFPSDVPPTTGEVEFPSDVPPTTPEGIIPEVEFPSDVPPTTREVEFPPDVPPDTPEGEIPEQGDDEKDSEIAITNKLSESSYEWQFSNPKGYAAWFMLMSIKDDVPRAVESAPNYQREKLPLQRVVQMLKRHRDLWIRDRSTYTEEDKPISIIITTLAAKAYANNVDAGETKILQALQTVVENMYCYIDGENRVSNPVSESENFADKWVDNPQLRDCFKAWHEQVCTDLNDLNSATSVEKIWEVLALFLGEPVVAKAKTESMLTIRRL